MKTIVTILFIVVWCAGFFVITNPTPFRDIGILMMFGSLVYSVVEYSLEKSHKISRGKKISVSDSDSSGGL